MPELVKTIELILQAVFGLAFELLVRGKKYLYAVLTLACGHMLYLFIGHSFAVPIRLDDSSSRISELQEKLNAQITECAKEHVKAAKDTAKSNQESFLQGFDSGFSKARNDLSREQFLAGQVAARQAVETEALAREQKLKDTIRVAEEEAEHQARTIKRLSSTITDHEQRSATMAQILESLERQLNATMSYTRQGQPKDSFQKFQTSTIESTRNYYPAPVKTESQERDSATRSKEEEKFQMDRKAYLYMIYKR
jgi:uncharacterized coiled-coil protein SlyX